MYRASGRGVRKSDIADLRYQDVQQVQWYEEICMLVSQIQNGPYIAGKLQLIGSKLFEFELNGHDRNSKKFVRQSRRLTQGTGPMPTKTRISR